MATSGKLRGQALMLLVGGIIFASLIFRHALAQKSQTIAVMCTVERTLRDYMAAIDRECENGTFLQNTWALQQLQQFTDKRRRVKMNVNGKSVWVEPYKAANSLDDYPGWYRRDEFQAARDRLSVLFRQVAKYPDMVEAAKKQFARDTSYAAWRKVLDPIRTHVASRKDMEPIQFVTPAGWSALIQCGASTTRRTAWEPTGDRVLIWDLSRKAPYGVWHTAMHKLPVSVKARSPADATLVFVIETRGARSEGTYVPEGRGNTSAGGAATRETIVVSVYDSSNAHYCGSGWLEAAMPPNQIFRPGGSHAGYDSTVGDDDLVDFVGRFFEVKRGVEQTVSVPTASDNTQ